jgi:tRNA 2-thiocytidine biosynthesis protein TtcA
MKETERLERRLLRATARAIEDFDLVADGDRILVAVSGGKDSYVLLHLLSRLRERAPIQFELTAVNLDQGHPGFPAATLEAHFRAVGVPYRMLSEDTLSIVKRVVPEGGTYCSACSRLRRGILYNAAIEMGCNKIALGHHRDDLIETLLMSALYSGRLQTMPVKLRSDDGRNMVIRPMAYAAEEEVMRFPIVPCGLCGSQPNLMRKRVKALLAELSAEHPAVKGNLLSALSRVIPSRLLDRDLQQRLGEVTGRDPWIDAEDGETSGCVEAADPAVVMLSRARGEPG